MLAFCSPQKSYVAGDPGYEAGGRAAKFIGARAINVPLTKDYAHDVKAMAAADTNAGLIYLCNPNNPTGSLTSREDMEWLLANKPAGSILVVDEAYIHIADSASTMDQIGRAGQGRCRPAHLLQALRHGGLRAGAAIGRPDLLEKIMPYSAGAMPVTAMVGATTSLKVKNLVADRRKIIKDIREDTLAFLDKHQIHYVPSVSNKFMVDTKRPGREVIDAMAKEKVYIGRVWPCGPLTCECPLAARDDMAKFKAAFLKVMA